MGVPESHTVDGQVARFLVRKEGPNAGTLYEVRAPVTTIGRAPENDVAIAGTGRPGRFGRHAELRLADGLWRIVDLESTNGTFVDGERVTEAALDAPATIQLGKGGPELHFTAKPPESAGTDLNRTHRRQRHANGRHRPAAHRSRPSTTGNCARPSHARARPGTPAF